MTELQPNTNNRWCFPCCCSGFRHSPLFHWVAALLVPNILKEYDYYTFLYILLFHCAFYFTDSLKPTNALVGIRESFLYIIIDYCGTPW